MRHAGVFGSVSKRMPVKRIVCLANSRKFSGRCIAGKELRDAGQGEWIRPVSAREHQEVSEYERQYQNGNDPQPLHVIDIPLIERAPTAYQRENWLLDPDAYWVMVRALAPHDLAALTDPVGRLWINGSSTYNGTNDKVPIAAAVGLNYSLRLIQVDGVTLNVFDAGFDRSKRRVQAGFFHGGMYYALWVTDPRYEREYLARPNGEYELGPCFLTISLGEEYKGDCYKLVAAIIPL